MKTNNKTTPPASSTAAAPNCRWHQRGLWWAATGFAVGVVTPVAYLLLGGDYILNIPVWASIVGYPGFLAGYAVYDSGLSHDASLRIGVLAMGLSYTTLAVLARLLGSKLKLYLGSGRAR